MNACASSVIPGLRPMLLAGSGYCCPVCRIRLACRGGAGELSRKLWLLRNFFAHPARKSSAVNKVSMIMCLAGEGEKVNLVVRRLGAPRGQELTASGLWPPRLQNH